MNRSRFALGLAMAAMAAALFGCGGGGGGAPPADVQGRIQVLPTGGQNAPLPPNPAATVTINGQSTTTDANGNFVLRGVSSTSLQITITAQGEVALTQNLPTLTPNAVNDLGDIFLVSSDPTLKLAYNATASGQVVRADTLAPVSGATVRLNGQVVVTGADGNVSFSGLPPGLGGRDIQVGVVKATAQGFEDKPIVLDLPLGPSPPNNDLGLIKLAPPVGHIPDGPTDISGTISLQGQTDLSGTTVTLIDKNSGQALGSQTTAADGKFGFWVIAGNYTVQAAHTGFQTKSQDVTLARPDQPQTVNLTLTP